VLVGQSLDHGFIDNLTKKAEQLIDRKIIYVVMTPEQVQYFLKDKAVLLIWQSDDIISRMKANDANDRRT
jgi:hypothetical protein